MLSKKNKREKRKQLNQKYKERQRERKERNKIFKKKKYICKNCGHLGKPIKTKKGSWLLFKIRFIIVSPVFVIVFFVSLLEGLLHLFSFSSPKSIIWENFSFKKYMPDEPYTLKGCKNCHKKNSMFKLKTIVGRDIYDRFKRDRFLIRR